MAKKLKFYDVKRRKSFMSTKYRVVSRNNRRFAVAIAPSGSESWRVLGKAK